MKRERVGGSNNSNSVTSRYSECIAILCLKWWGKLMASWAIICASVNIEGHDRHWRRTMIRVKMKQSLCQKWSNAVKLRVTLSNYRELINWLRGNACRSWKCFHFYLAFSKIVCCRLVVPLRPLLWSILNASTPVLFMLHHPSDGMKPRYQVRPSSSLSPINVISLGQIKW